MVKESIPKVVFKTKQELCSSLSLSQLTKSTKQFIQL